MKPGLAELTGGGRIGREFSAASAAERIVTHFAYVNTFQLATLGTRRQEWSAGCPAVRDLPARATLSPDDTDLRPTSTVGAGRRRRAAGSMFSAREFGPLDDEFVLPRNQPGLALSTSLNRAHRRRHRVARFISQARHQIAGSPLAPHLRHGITQSANPGWTQ
jgi:hypothetical protein